MKTNATNKKRRTGATIIMITGLLLIAAALGLTAYNLWDDHRATAASDAVLQELCQAMTGEDLPMDPSDSDVLPDGGIPEMPTDPADAVPDLPDRAEEAPLWKLFPDRQIPTITIDGYRYIGTLEIPSRGIELPVMEEWDYDRLSIAPCRYEGSPYKDNLIICGHNYSGHFSEIRYFSIGAEVRFTDVENNLFIYEVDNIETTRPVYDQIVAGEWDLTLFTCHTGGQTRCVVRCIRVEPEK